LSPPGVFILHFTLLNFHVQLSHTATHLYSRIYLLSGVGGESIYYQGPHELCIIDGGPQNQLILS